MLIDDRSDNVTMPRIPGMQYMRDFISSDEAGELCFNIDRQPWRHDLKRRVQHYGYRYDYGARLAGPSSYLGPLPDWLGPLKGRLMAASLLQGDPNQVIVNEYLPGQGISPHVDCVCSFGPQIAILSLGTQCIMTFTHLQTGDRIPVALEERSLTILSGAARYDWQHGIPPRKHDIIDGAKMARRRRLSVTFRTVNAGGSC